MQWQEQVCTQRGSKPSSLDATAMFTPLPRMPSPHENRHRGAVGSVPASMSAARKVFKCKGLARDSAPSRPLHLMFSVPEILSRVYPHLPPGHPSGLCSPVSSSVRFSDHPPTPITFILLSLLRVSPGISHFLSVVFPLPAMRDETLSHSFYPSVWVRKWLFL